MNILNVFLIFYFSITSFCDGGAIFNNGGLYDNEDLVDVLWSENFREKVFNQKHAGVVEFYSSWCGYCQRFAPIWKNFAKSIELWSDIVRISAVDCANEINFDLCKEFEILSYPQLKFFHIGYEDGEGRIGQKMSKNFDVNIMRQTLIHQLMQEYEKNRHGRNWPNLNYYEENNVDGVWNNTSNATKHVFLIFETDNSTFFAHDVILDLHKNKNLTIRAVIDESGLAEALEVKHRPGLVAVSKNLKVKVLHLEDYTKDGIKSAIKTFMSHKHAPTPTPVVKTRIKEEVNETHSMESTTAIIPHVRITSDVVNQADLFTALRYTIYREIPRSSLINGEKLLALKRYLRVLAKYLNINRSVRTLLNNLKHDVNQVQKDLTGTAFMSMVREHDRDKRLFLSNKWMRCAGSQPGFRGFPCGLWILFHHLSISATYDKNVDPQEVLIAMHSYVKHFFGCGECSKHFQEMAFKNKIWSVPSSDEAVLWLWSAHNEVNKRLSGDATEDPLYPKIQFPRKQNCAACYNTVGHWNNVAVLSYLKKIYTKVVGVIKETESATKMQQNQTEVIQQRDCFNRKMMLCLIKLYKDDKKLFPGHSVDPVNGNLRDGPETQRCLVRWHQCRSTWVSLLENDMESAMIMEPHLSSGLSNPRLDKSTGRRTENPLHI